MLHNNLQLQHTEIAFFFNQIGEIFKLKLLNWIVIEILITWLSNNSNC